MTDRRNFLKNVTVTASGLLVLPLLSFGEDTTGQANEPKELEAGFLRPPLSAKPQAYWMWMNGHVTKNGITLDLERMKEMGLAGAFVYNTGTGIPAGPVVYGSAQWTELLLHAMQEAKRLGLELAVHNSPGFSSTGGKSVTPAMAMQQVVWTETTVKAQETVNAFLPQPHTKHGFYRDAFVVAFPSPLAERSGMFEALLRVNANGHQIDKTRLQAKHPQTILELQATADQPAVLELEFSEPFAASSITLTRPARFSQADFDAAYNRPFVFALEASDDGLRYEKVCTVVMPRLRYLDAPGSQNFSPVSARFFRLVAAQSTPLLHAELHTTTRLEGWPGKAGFTDADAADDNRNLAKEDVIFSADVIDVSAYMEANGQFNWKPPTAGWWTVLRLGHTCTGSLTVSSPDSATGLEIDKFSSQAVDDYFDRSLSEWLPQTAPFIPSVFKGLFIDSWEVGRQNWTAAFPAEFLRRRCYSLLPYVPALTGRVVQSPKATEKFLHDLRQTQAELVADNYYGRFRQRCAQLGLKLYAQPNGDGMFDSLQAGGQTDEALAEFWVRSYPGTLNLCKQAVSIGHGYGKKIIAAEAFTGLPSLSRWTEYPYALKAQGDYLYALGINRFVFHVFVHQPYTTGLPGMTMGPYGCHFDRNLTWGGTAKAWVDYLSRVQYLLQQGLPVADVCYFKGEEPASGIPDVHYVNPPVPHTLAGDVIGPDVLQRMSVKNNDLVLPDGMTYRLMILAPLQTLSVAVAEKLKKLVNDGMTLVVTSKPTDTPGHDSAGNLAKTVAELWGNLDGKAIKERSVGKGRICWNKPFADVLRQRDAEPDFFFAAQNPDAAIHFTHRRAGDTEIYFVSNHLRRQETVRCSFRVRDKTPEIWNPQTGERYFAAVYSTEENRVNLALQLGPADSLFVLFRGNKNYPPFDEVLKDGVPLLSAKPLLAGKPKPFAHIVNNFTLSVWVKPDVPSFHPKGAVIFPPEGEVVYGAGHTACGLSAGQNGVRLYERDRGPNHAARPVLAYEAPLEGWTHLVVRYTNGQPSLFLNGVLVKKAEPSKKAVHPGLGAPPTDEAFSAFFEGNQTAVELVPEALTDDAILRRYQKGLPSPEGPFAIQLSQTTDGCARAQVWQNGLYHFKRGSEAKTVDARDCAVTVLQTPWTVRFPAGSGAPPFVELKELASLHRHSHFDVRHFSGTAAWETSFRFNGKPSAKPLRVLLHLGRVEVIAAVKLNGKNLPILWKEPFAVDVTEALVSGQNRLQVSVTNLWPNRLIGDEHFPDEAEYNDEGIITRFPDWYLNNRAKPGPRKTFSAWNNFQKTDPLLESGLLGPVRLFTGVEAIIE